MEFRVKNCCHPSDLHPRFRASSGDRVLVRMADQTLRLAKIVAITADDHVEVKIDDSDQEAHYIPSANVVALFLGD